MKAWEIHLIDSRSETRFSSKFWCQKESTLPENNNDGVESVDNNSDDVTVPYFLDYSAPLFSSRPRIDRALCPGLRVILRALE